ncbi:SEC-C domain-containing protein [Paenibacillus maysiensis]|uniref:SEC-C domain-containing protein n=1 Tax=Paenibacillus maysiensis TaxID=1155954 RepID=UPI00046EC3AB|nr:SEC-C domain-containing protein [Paenibacillus maysiensis]
MTQLGRNDLCHCGSGKKYKKCCLDQDQQAQREQHSSFPNQEPGNSTQWQERIEHTESPQKFRKLIGKLNWPTEAQYQLADELFMALYAENNLKSLIVRGCLMETLLLWNNFCNLNSPSFRKPGGYKAALEYFFLTEFGMLVTQADLATKHGVSVSSLSNNLRRLEDFFEEYGTENDNLAALTSSNKVEEMTAYSELEHEKMLRKIQKLMESQDHEGLEDAQNFLALQLNNSELLRNDSPISLEEKAYELMIRAESETSLAKKKKLISQARELDPNNVDALLMLSKLATDISEAIKLANSAMTYARDELGEDFFVQNKEYFWGMVETRPYMRSKELYAKLVYTSGRISAACEQYEQLLALNPNDNQGIRYSLLLCYLELERFEQAEQLLQSYANEGSTEFQYGKLALEYLQNGETANLTFLYKLARKQNRHVPAYLLGKKTLPSTQPQYMTPGDINDAVQYVDSHENLWARLYGLVEWMRKQA